VLPADLEPPPPLMTFASFANDGGSVVVSFDSPTNRGNFLNTFACSSLLDMKQLTSTSSRCVWINDQSFSIFPLTSAGLLNVGDELTLRDSKIRAKCRALPNVIPCQLWKNSSSVIINISFPLNPITPSVNILSSSMIGPCDSLSFDLSTSRGSGGRSFKTPLFQIIQTIPFNQSLSSTSLNSILDYLSSHHSLVSPFSLPSFLFQSGSGYQITVTLCNFLNRCSQSSHSFLVSESKEIPQVSIHSSKLRLIKRGSPLIVTGQATTTACGGGSSSTNLALSWRMVSESGSIVQSLSNDPIIFLLPSYSLEVGATYSLTLTAVHSHSAIASSSSISVHVTSGNIIAQLSSGSSEILLPIDSSVVIDGSSSYDEDLSPSSSSSSSSSHLPSLLSYSFSCIQLMPSYQPTCLLDFSIGNTDSSCLVKVRQGSHLNWNETLDTISQVTLTVTHRLDNRTSQASVTIKVISPEAPHISIASGTGIKINPSQKLKLFGDILYTNSGVATWSVDDPNLSLSAHALSDTTKTLLSSTTSPISSSFHLVLPPDLLPQQSIFTFTLTCTLATGYSSSSSIVITTNSPPSPGQYDISPTQGGVMLQTLFSFVASHWEDDDLPISYEFSYQSLSSGDTYLVFRSRMEVSFTSSTLPMGRNDGSNLLTTRVSVFDSLDGRSRSTLSVEVLETIFTVNEVQDLVLTSLNSSVGDVEAITNVFSLTTTVLNSVNCNESPDCVSLNRSPCSTTVGTCGNCLNGYLGEPGHANTKCITLPTLASSSRRLLSKDHSGDCQKDIDCSEDGWKVCDLQTHQCKLQSKSCPNNCSNAGRCFYHSKYNSSVLFRECSLWNVNCEASCECFPERKGVTCSHDLESYERLLMTRHHLIEALESISLIQEITKTSIISTLDRLSTISSDHTSLSDETKILIASLTLQYLTHAIDLKLSSEDISAVGRILNLILDASLENQTNSELMRSLLQSYNDFILSDMTSGQRPITLVNQLYRTTHYSLEQDENTLYSPLSPLEEFLETPRQSAQLLIPTLENEIKVSIIESSFLQKNHSFQRYSVPFGLQFDHPPCYSSISSASLSPPPSTSPSSSSSCVTHITLQKLSICEDQNQDSLSTRRMDGGGEERREQWLFEMDCQEGNYSTQQFICPNHERISLSCNGSAGTISQHCPIHNSSFVCASLSSHHLCTVLSETISNITCECSLLLKTSSSSPSSPPQDLPDQSSAVINFEVIAQSVTYEFVSTWKSAGSMSAHDVAENLIVLFTISSVAIVGFLFICISTYLDKRHHDQQKRSILKMMTATQTKNPHNLKETIPKPFLSFPKSLSLPFSFSLSSLSSNSSQIKPRHQRRAMIQRKVVIGANEEKRIEESLPLVMRPIPFIEKCKHEMILHHRWIGVLSHYSSEYPRPYRLLSLWMNVVIMLFIQSLTYNIADPDNGSCERLKTLHDCLSLKSSLSSSPQCQWDEETGLCSYRPIQNDFSRVLVVAVLCGVLSSPFSILFQSLILFVLSAKTKQMSNELQKSRVTRVSQLHHRPTRVSSIQPNREGGGKGETSSSVSLATTLQQDFGQLLQNLRLFYKQLPPDQVAEFECKSLLISLCLTVSLSLPLSLSRLTLSLSLSHLTLFLLL
jgi:hypothetical protein